MIVYAAAASWGQLLFFVAIGLVLFALPSWVALDSGTLAGAVLTTLYTASPLEAIMGWLPAHRSGAGVAAKGGGPRRDSAASRSRPTRRQVATRADGATVELMRRHAHLPPRGRGRRLPARADRLETAARRSRLPRRRQRVRQDDAGESACRPVRPGEAARSVVNGRPVTTADREAYRQHFSAVFADFYLFERLVGLGRPESRRPGRPLLAASAARPKGGGPRRERFRRPNLSQGQRKRLALLTAYLEDRPVYLFDEWAADQDPVFKKVFYTQLLPELKARGKAVLVISHDERYFGMADRVVRLDYGKLAPEGSGHVPAASA